MAFTAFSKAFGNTIPDMAIRPWMLQVGWRLERVRSLLTGSTPFMTKATTHSAVIDRTFSSKKVDEFLGHRSFKVEVMAENMARYFSTGADH